MDAVVDQPPAIYCLGEIKLPAGVSPWLPEGWTMLSLAREQPGADGRQHGGVALIFRGGNEAHRAAVLLSHVTGV